MLPTDGLVQSRSRPVSALGASAHRGARNATMLDRGVANDQIFGQGECLVQASDRFREIQSQRFGFVTAHSDALRLTEISPKRARNRRPRSYKAPGLFKLVIDCRESDARDRGRYLYPDFDF